MGANITLMIQADMLAYHVSHEPPQLGLPKSWVTDSCANSMLTLIYLFSIGTPEVAQLAANISAIYSLELNVGFTPACCSDHQVCARCAPK